MPELVGVDDLAEVGLGRVVLLPGPSSVAVGNTGIGAVRVVGVPGTTTQ